MFLKTMKLMKSLVGAIKLEFKIIFLLFVVSVSNQ